MNVLYWISGILGFVANLPYIRDIVISRNTDKPLKPIRISWFIFFILDLLIVFSSISNGKTILEIALPIGYMIGAFLIALLSIPYGSWIESTSPKTGLAAFRNEFIILGVSILGILIWQFGNSSISLIAFCIALIIGAKPTIERLWNNPSSEPKTPWTMWALGSIFSVICLGNPMTWTLTGSLVSLVYLSLNIPILYALYLKKI